MLIIETRTFKKQVDFTYAFYAKELPYYAQKVVSKAITQWKQKDLIPEITKNLSGGVLTSRSGTLLKYATNSRNISVMETDTGWEVFIREAKKVPHLTVYEYGGIVKPKRAKALAIPIEDSPADAAHLPAPRRPKPRSFKNTFIRNGIIFQRVGRDAIPLFSLHKEVELPPRPWFFPAVNKAWKRMNKRLREAQQAHKIRKKK